MSIFGRSKELTFGPTAIKLRNDGIKAPKKDLVIDYVYGYHGHPHNLFWLSENEFVYFIAAICVVQNTNKWSMQRTYTGHSNDVTCIAQCKGLCASGQIDPPGVGGPYICLWSPNSIEKTIFELHWHENEVTSLIFSNCGRRLYSFGGDPHHMLAIWRIPEVRPGSDSVKLTNPLQTISTGKSRVPLSVGLHNSCSFVTFGTNLKFWNYETDGITQNLSIFGKFNTPKTVLCVAPCRDGTCLVSGDNGYIYWFTGNSCKQEQKISSHPVGCICEWGETGSYICSDDVGEMYYGNQTVSPIRLDMNNSKKINNSKSAAMAPLGGLSPLLLVGYDDKLILFDMDNKEIDRVVQCGHRGDIWGISHHPKLSFLASVGWDKNIMFWNIVKKIPSQTFRCEFKCQTVEFSPEGDLIAIGEHIP
eukprot:GHVL01013867.1.p1 GENE.GHVL01013867.1~~GHVL01013867.1.p1  ORF type:complete len:418 (+),score=66.33 GHVL01013867.1:95-1348(+)